MSQRIPWLTSDVPSDVLQILYKGTGQRKSTVSPEALGQTWCSHPLPLQRMSRGSVQCLSESSLCEWENHCDRFDSKTPQFVHKKYFIYIISSFLICPINYKAVKQKSNLGNTIRGTFCVWVCVCVHFKVFMQAGAVTGVGRVSHPEAERRLVLALMDTGSEGSHLAADSSLAYQPL